MKDVTFTRMLYYSCKNKTFTSPIGLTIFLANYLLINLFVLFEGSVSKELNEIISITFLSFLFSK